MADELQANLSEYQLQFQQVESALTTDPNNGDLLKLQKDLQEVIDLTEDLIRTQLASVALPAPPVAISETHAAAPTPAAPAARRQWRTGDKCGAVWSEDGGCYDAVLEEVLEDGTCTVTFDHWGNTEVTKVVLLKSAEEMKRKKEEEGESSKMKPKTKRDKMAAEREYKKKKAQKKAQRVKAQEEEREGEKNKWLDFNSKVFSKTSKGKVKKSIFASPDTPVGRVGVGTCGVSGKPMTSFAQHEKWKK